MRQGLGVVARRGILVADDILGIEACSHPPRKEEKCYPRNSQLEKSRDFVDG